MVCGLWSVVCRQWSVVCGLSSVVCRLWSVVCRLSGDVLAFPQEDALADVVEGQGFGDAARDTAAHLRGHIHRVDHAPFGGADNGQLPAIALVDGPLPVVASAEDLAEEGNPENLERPGRGRGALNPLVQQLKRSGVVPDRLASEPFQLPPGLLGQFHHLTSTVRAQKLQRGVHHTEDSISQKHLAASGLLSISFSLPLDKLRTLENLIRSLGAEQRVVFTVDGQWDDTPLRGVPGVTRVERVGERTVVYGRGEGLVGGVVSALEGMGVRFRDLRTEQPTLEDVFLALTGREMRE